MKYTHIALIPKNLSNATIRDYNLISFENGVIGVLGCDRPFALKSMHTLGPFIEQLLDVGVAMAKRGTGPSDGYWSLSK